MSKPKIWPPYIPARIRNGVDRYAFAHSGHPKPCQLQLAGVHDPTTWTEYHHRRMRSRGGPHTEANLLLLCDACHQWIHYPGGPTRWAIQAGVLLLRSPRRKWRVLEVAAAGLLRPDVIAEATRTRRR